MRDINFRVWDSKNKAMSDVKEMAWGKDGILVGTRDFALNSMHGERVNAYKCFALMQYTGLKDKNGKEIYEGDIVKPFLRDDKLEVVKIHDAIYCEPFHYYDSPEDFEVIGNIYENPELLESK
jgi:uncharacterized phage protein (TIGR01671 family)